MKSISLLSLIFLGLILLLDTYAFQAVFTATKGAAAKIKTLIHGTYWFVTAFTIIGLAIGAFTDTHEWAHSMRNYFIAFLIINIVSKLFVTVTLFFNDGFRMGNWVIAQFVPNTGKVS
ncbi:MAG: hypothetical protein BRD50_02520, partial [Bacteroidetes bacterium SW_11_45_7]